MNTPYLGRDKPVAAGKPAYLADFFARFFFAFGVNGAGGVDSIRRSTSSALGCAGSRFCLVMVMVRSYA